MLRKDGAQNHVPGRDDRIVSDQGWRRVYSVFGRFSGHAGWFDCRIEHTIHWFVTCLQRSQLSRELGMDIYLKKEFQQYTGR